MDPYRVPTYKYIYIYIIYTIHNARVEKEKKKRVMYQPLQSHKINLDCFESINSGTIYTLKLKSFSAVSRFRFKDCSNIDAQRKRNPCIYLTVTDLYWRALILSVINLLSSLAKQESTHYRCRSLISFNQKIRSIWEAISFSPLHLGEKKKLFD